MASTLYTFGDLVVDEGLYELRRGEDVIRLEPKVFDFLLFPLRNRDRVCSKDELLDALWPHETVSESVLPTNAAAVRRALRGDPVGEPGIGKTFTAIEAARSAITRGAEVLTGPASSRTPRGVDVSARPRASSWPRPKTTRSA